MASGLILLGDVWADCRRSTKRPARRPIDHERQIDALVREVEQVFHIEFRLKFLCQD